MDRNRRHISKSRRYQYNASDAGSALRENIPFGAWLAVDTEQDHFARASVIFRGRVLYVLVLWSVICGLCITYVATTMSMCMLFHFLSSFIYEFSLSMGIDLAKAKSVDDSAKDAWFRHVSSTPTLCGSRCRRVIIFVSSTTLVISLENFGLNIDILIPNSLSWRIAVILVQLH